MGTEENKEELSKFRQRRIVELEKEAAAQKKIEEAIKFSETRYRRLFEAAQDGILIVDPATGRISDVNPTFLKLLGYSLKDLLDKKLWETGPFKNISANHDFFSNMQSKEYLRHDELPLETKDGRVVEVEFVSNIYMVDEVKVVQCNIRSIADRKRAEEALRVSETYFEELFTSMTEGVAVHRIIYDEKGTATDYVILNVNPAYEVHTGIERKDAIGKRASELYATGKPPYFDIYEKVAATKRPAHFETYFEPLKRHFRISVFSPGEGLFATVFDDITERKKGEDALKESEQRFRDITENALEWIWEVDTTGKYTFVSHVVEKILGYRADEIMGKHFYDLFHPEDKEALKSAAFEVFAKKHPFREFLNRNIHKSGKTVWLSTSGTPIFDDKGNLLGYRGADTDITDIREAAEALRDSEELFLSVTQSALDAIIVVDGSGTIQVWNKAAETLFGYSMLEAHGKPVTMIIPERLRMAHKKGMRRFMSSGKSKIMGRNYEVTARHKDGSEFPVEISLASWERKGNVLFTGVIRDITTRKKLEEQLQTASITDELTGLLNRRGFLSFAQKYVEIARRNKRNFSILYIDLNEMKKINDEFGHREGDQALLDIAEILRKTFRSSDIIARIGGDEFTVLMTDTHDSAVEETIAQYIRNNLRIHNERTEKGYELSVSMGMVHNDPEQRCSIDELLAQADELMYEHKKLKAETIPSSTGRKREERVHERYTSGSGSLAELVVSGSAMIKDISLGGISLRTSQRLTKNTMYRVKLLFADHEGLSINSIAVWSSLLENVSEKDDAKPYYEAGLRFIELDEHLRESLEKLVISVAK